MNKVSKLYLTIYDGELSEEVKASNPEEYIKEHTFTLSTSINCSLSQYIDWLETSLTSTLTENLGVINGEVILKEDNTLEVGFGSEAIELSDMTFVFDELLTSLKEYLN